MNSKISKLKDEKQKNDNKIAELQERNREIDKKIREYENTDIIGLVRSCDLSIDELAELLNSAGKNKTTLKGGN